MQWVRVYWTRRTRGGRAAAKRNALPQAFPLPNAEPPFVHEVWMSESRDFEPVSELKDGLPGEDQVELTESDSRLYVKLVPELSHYNLRGLEPGWARTGVPLKRRHALRWQINYLITMNERGWYYRLDTLNVAYGARSAEVFVHPPVRTIDGRTHLYWH